MIPFERVHSLLRSPVPSAVPTVAPTVVALGRPPRTASQISPDSRARTIPCKEHFCVL